MTVLAVRSHGFSLTCFCCFKWKLIAFDEPKKKRDVDFHSDSQGNDLCRDPISQNGVKKAQLNVSMFVKYSTAGA